MRKPNIPQPEQDRRARQWIGTQRALFNWAVEKDRLPASPLARMRPPTKERTRDRVLSDNEIRWFWEACDEIGWPFGPLFKLLLLTAQRRDEVAGMARSEIDLEKRVWTIPRHNTKNDRGHEVQLSDFGMQWPRRNCFGLHCHWRYAGEATGVRRGDELFRVRPLLVFEPGPERIRGFCEHTGIGGKMTVAGATSSAPDRFRLADHVRSPLLLCVLKSLEFLHFKLCTHRDAVRVKRHPELTPWRHEELTRGEADDTDQDANGAGVG